MAKTKKKKSRNLIRQLGQKNQAALIGSQSVRGFLIGKVGQHSCVAMETWIQGGLWSVCVGYGGVSAVIENEG